MENIGKRIKMLRERQNLTLKELGELAKVHFARISKFERGLETPGKEVIKRLESALGASFSDFEKTVGEINEIFVKFVDSLYYYENEFQRYLEIISANNDNYIVCHNYYKILLIRYVIDVLNNVDYDLKQEKLLEKLVRGDTECYLLFIEYKGVYLHKMNKYKDAIKLLENVVILDVDEKIKTMVYYHLSMFYKDYNNLEKARYWVELARNGFYQGASIQRAIFCEGIYAGIFIRTRNYDAAIKCYDRCILSVKKFLLDDGILALVLRNKAWALILKGNYELSLDAINESETYQPDHDNVAIYKIWCMLKTGKYKIARNLISKYNYLLNDASYSERFKLFTDLAYLENNKPTKAMIKLACKLYEDFCNKSRYDLMVFYLDIVLDLLRQRKEIDLLNKYLELKIELLESSC